MPEINRTALVRFSADQMFHLVNDVNAYPEFLPGCMASEILEHDTAMMLASVSVKKAGVMQTFVTRNSLSHGSEIGMELDSGPFKTLQGGWRFTPLRADACKIEFNLNFEFSNSMVAKAFGKIFNDLAQNMVQAFTDRAKDVYRV